MQRTFQDTSRLGEAGKRLVMSHLQKCGYQVQDLTAQREYTSRLLTSLFRMGTNALRLRED